MALSSISLPPKSDAGHSPIIFIALVSIAALVWLAAMIALAGGWRKISAYLPRGVSIGSVSGVALLLICVLLIVVYRHEERGHPARAKLIAREVVRLPDQLAQTSKAPAPAAKAEASTKRSPGVAPPLLKSVPSTTTPPLPAAKDEKAATVPSLRVEKTPSAVPEEVVSSDPSPGRSRDRIAKEPVSRSSPFVAGAKLTDRDLPGLHGSLTTEPSMKRAVVIGRGTKALSEAQARQVCGAVNSFAGAQVYIKWSPGANAGQLATQLSKAMDCARVTVTFASESEQPDGHGVLVGTHADEGETSDRIRPFADAITAALREQGFRVAEVSGADIPANQTAIFIGSD